MELNLIFPSAPHFSHRWVSACILGFLSDFSENCSVDSNCKEPAYLDKNCKCVRPEDFNSGVVTTPTTGKSEPYLNQSSSLLSSLLFVTSIITANSSSKDVYRILTRHLQVGEAGVPITGMMISAMDGRKMGNAITTQTGWKKTARSHVECVGQLPNQVCSIEYFLKSFFWGGFKKKSGIKK